jgi:hypothetical protein
MVSAAVVMLVLAGSFAFTFALMWGLQRMGCFADSAVQPVTGHRLPVVRYAGPPMGPDDDLAFLQELRRRIDLGHFQR